MDSVTHACYSESIHCDFVANIPFLCMNPLSLEQIVNEIEAGIANQTFTPTRAADLIVFLGVKYSRAVDNYMIAKAEYAKAFTSERANYKSDSATERALDYQEVGLTVSNWKAQRDKADTLISTLKGFIYQKSAESRNEQ